MTNSDALLEQRKTVLEQRSIPELRKKIEKLARQLKRTSGEHAAHIKRGLNRLEADLSVLMKELAVICTALGLRPDPNPATT